MFYRFMDNVFSHLQFDALLRMTIEFVLLKRRCTNSINFSF
jgi:hypothetical protein